MPQSVTAAWLLGLFLLLTGCGDQDGSRLTPGLGFDEFLAGYTPPRSRAAVADDRLPAGVSCTPLPDGPPFAETIAETVSLIRRRVDPAFVDEALAHLEGGISFLETHSDDVAAYSAMYRDRTVFLFDSLFEFGCIEDVASTLLHEMVHAVQRARYLGNGDRAGGFDLSGTDARWLEAELMAESYQIMVSRRLGWLSAGHAAKILRLHNRRLAQIP